MLDSSDWLIAWRPHILQSRLQFSSCRRRFKDITSTKTVSFSAQLAKWAEMLQNCSRGTYLLRRRTSSCNKVSEGAGISSLLIFPLSVRGHTGQLTKTFGTMNFGRDDVHNASSIVLNAVGRRNRVPGVDACSLGVHFAIPNDTYAHKKSCWGWSCSWQKIRYRTERALLLITWTGLISLTMQPFTSSIDATIASTSPGSMRCPWIFIWLSRLRNRHTIILQLLIIGRCWEQHLPSNTSAPHVL